MTLPETSSYRQQRYNIKNNVEYYNGHFDTGRLGNGTQILMGAQMPEVVLVEFDASGNYLKTSAREFSDEEFHKDGFEARIQNWQEEIGFIPALISIKGFFFKERWIGIQDLPDHYQEVIDNPEEFEEERRQELQEDIRLWFANGDFVLWWAQDYYFTQDGEMASS